MRPVIASALLLLALCGPATGTEDGSAGPVRAQRDTVGFAVSREDFAKVLYAAFSAEDLDDPRARRAAEPASVVILPHDDYLYAGRTAVHGLAHLRAKRWILFGVCHACRRIGVRDRLLLDDFAVWNVAGSGFPVDAELRDVLLQGMPVGMAAVDAERHAAEHSLEAMLPWIGAAVGDFTFVPVLVPGMEPDRIELVAGRLAGVLAEICRERGWKPGRDLGIVISADAVHYGCEGWGGSGYAPFGCGEAGHAAARARDVTLAEATLAGPLTVEGIASFIRLVWDREGPEYPAEPYRITWCGLYSIPFGLTTALRLQEDLGLPPLTGDLLRYGDSVSDGRLQIEGARLGVTAPNTLGHWVGYPAVGYW
ncbi:MAG: AmmeMemoRadiSam system protein B [Candidatus Krumholzibacteriia bacterium]